MVDGTAAPLFRTILLAASAGTGASCVNSAKTSAAQRSRTYFFNPIPSLQAAHAAFLLVIISQHFPKDNCTKVQVTGNM